MNSRRRVNSAVRPLASAIPMKRILISIVGGLLVMLTCAVGFLFGARQFFKWAMAWPTLFLYRFFPPPSPDQIFPKLGSDSGVLCTFAVTTLSYSLVIYVALWLFSKTSRAI
jgi:hypothetical protein